MKLVSATTTTASYHNLDIIAGRVSDIGQRVARSATFRRALVDARIVVLRMRTMRAVAVVAAEEAVEQTPKTLL
jgi:hypothetical protein